MAAPKTISEKILSDKSGTDARAGDVVVCTVDRIIGTDASSPMAIDYFEQMGGERLFDPARVFLALDHYAPPTSPGTQAFHQRIRAFASQHGAELHEVGEGISFQRASELGRVLPGDLVVGADSHTVTCGALNAFAIGVGSSDLAAAMLTGEIWLRVPETIRAVLQGPRPAGLSGKDIALALVAAIGAEGASYQAIEFVEATPLLSLDDRMVLCNLAVEMDAKAAIFAADDITRRYLANRTTRAWTAVQADEGARYAREVVVDLATLAPRIALPHAPDNVVPLAGVIGIPIQMVFVGTCTGGRAADIREVMAVLEHGGGHIAAGVQLVVTPASSEVAADLQSDGTLARLVAIGAVVTTPGCGACCGTSGVIPLDGTNVLSTANRNFKARMGNPTAAIYLASPAACAAAAVTGVITDPASLGRSP